MKITLKDGDLLTYRYINGVKVTLAYDSFIDGNREIDTEYLKDKDFLLSISRNGLYLYKKELS